MKYLERHGFTKKRPGYWVRDDGSYVKIEQVDSMEWRADARMAGQWGPKNGSPGHPPVTTWKKDPSPLRAAKLAWEEARDIYGDAEARGSSNSDFFRW